jgi:hypothetical protein
MAVVRPNRVKMPAASGADALVPSVIKGCPWTIAMMPTSLPSAKNVAIADTSAVARPLHAVAETSASCQGGRANSELQPLVVWLHTPSPAKPAPIDEVVQ